MKNKARAEIWVKPADLIALVGALPNGTDVTSLEGFNQNDRPRVLDVRSDPDAKWVQLAVRVPTNTQAEGDIRVERADLGAAIGALLKQSSL
ncbi:MAG: hypothetical protein IPF99_30300 [Deltaproteobacteria bacterium]|nr:hypothetical protein [Deltaproteobacteria bacterium]